MALSDLTNAAARAIILRSYPGAKVGLVRWARCPGIAHNGRALTFDDPLRRAVRTIKEFPIPIIAMVEGGVWGGPGRWL